jgi:hypothetical protein
MLEDLVNQLSLYNLRDSKKQEVILGLSLREQLLSSWKSAHQ